ncbi:MAG: prolyl oligopeptidase family serine peptidase [Candidatus Solibacter sp.]
MAVVFFASLALSKTFTLEQALSAPFPYELTAAPGGGKVAWVLNERGARNIWVAAAPDFKGVRLTNYTQDDGQDLGQLRWTADARSVVYVRGGDLEYLGRAEPNPAQDTAGVQQAIWVATPGEAPRKLAAGHSPEISPKGDVLVYLSGGSIWSVPVTGNTGAAPLFQQRSGVQAGELHWSPDGSKLAFVSDRTTHSIVAVYDFAAKTLSYLDPGVDQDTEPVWSPDGKQIAFLRMASGGGSRGARRTGDPWSIRVASVATGEGREVWQAQAGAGSVFRGIVAADQLKWTSGNRIVFPWERDGWTHLYSVAVDGGAAALLTPGEFEVEHVTFSQDGSEVVYVSNQDDLDRRHIWRVPSAGGRAPVAVTKGESIEWSPVAVQGGLAYLRSEAKRPARAVVQLGGSARDLAPETVPAGFPADDLVTPQQVIYSATDGMPVHAQLFLPPGGTGSAKRKALVFLHGGSRRQMLLGWHYMDYYNNAYAMNQFLANQGYIVLAINYRSGIGYGLNFREALNFGATGASEFSDVEGAGLYLRNRPDVDAAHIGLWGGSYGGYLTALGLARASNLFAAGVDFHGVHDWSTRFAAGSEERRTAFDASPMAAVKTWKSPVLLIAGDDDRNVNFAETIAMVNALRRADVYFEQLILPDEIHTFLRHASWLRGYQAAADFFQRKL